MESDVRENIKNSALQLFNEPGYDATGIRELSAQAGCSLPMMYYYFESKEKLLHEIAVKDFVSLVDDIFAQAVKKNNLMDFALCFRLYGFFKKKGKADYAAWPVAAHGSSLWNGRYQKSVGAA